MLDLCQPCKEKGRFRAPYKMIGGVQMCGGCVADYEEEQRHKPKPPAPAPIAGRPPAVVQEPRFEPERKQEKKGRMIDQGTKTKIFEMAKAGKALTEICSALNVSYPTAKRYSTEGANGAKPAGGGDKRASRKNGVAKVRVVSPGGQFSATISQLREKRDRIDGLIRELEELS